MFNKVVLPDPLAPTRAVTSPIAQETLVFRRISFSFTLKPKFWQLNVLGVAIAPVSLLFIFKDFSQIFSISKKREIRTICFCNVPVIVETENIDEATFLTYEA